MNVITVDVRLFSCRECVAYDHPGRRGAWIPARWVETPCGRMQAHGWCGRAMLRELLDRDGIIVLGRPVILATKEE